MKVRELSPGDRIIIRHEPVTVVRTEWWAYDLMEVIYRGDGIKGVATLGADDEVKKLGRKT